MKTHVLAAGIAATSWLVPLQAEAASFSGLYVFGDSLSDSGNLFEISSTLLGTGFPPPPYVNGRLTNGNNWIDYLADDLSLQPTLLADVLLKGATPSQGVNFAFGGATTGTENTIPVPSQFDVLPGLQQQVAFSLGIPADPDALYIVWGGANDYLPTQDPDFVPFTEPDRSVANLSAAIAVLYATGARNFLVPNLPDLGQVPLVVDTPLSASLNVLSNEHNALLANALNGLSLVLPSSNIQSLDINTLFKQAIAGEFGFTNVTEPCFNQVTGTVCSNPDNFLFWDPIHPTTVAHQQIAELAYRQINHGQLETGVESVPEPATVLGLMTVGAIGIKTLRRKQQQ